jgi:hypothetical protein
MTTPTRIEAVHIDEAQRAAAERESLAMPAWIETLGFERLICYVFFDDKRLSLDELKELVEDWSAYLALKRIILLWPQTPAPNEARDARTELVAIQDGSQSLRDHAIRRLIEIIGAPAGLAETTTAIRFQRVVGRFGSEIIFENGIAKVGYKIFGSGESGSVDLPFYRLDSVARVAAPWGWNTRIDEAARVVTVNIPTGAAGLGRGMVAEVWLSGNGS